MLIGQSAGAHFSRVAHIYSEIRSTDPEIAQIILRHTPKKTHLEVADVGCGTGRYSDLLLNEFGENTHLFCCDVSDEMLSECRRNLRQTVSGKRVDFLRIIADNLPFMRDGIDVLTTFNAVHHFNLDGFISEAARVLTPGGLLAIYTRTPEQNTRTIWGRYFPRFTDYERRLHSRTRLEESIHRASELALIEVQNLSFRRTESIDDLIGRTRDHHYSTFALYPDDEFAESLQVFKDRLAEESDADGMIVHSPENTLVLARR